MRMPLFATLAIFAGLIGAAHPALAQEPPAVVCRQGQPKEAIEACNGILARKDLSPEVRALTLTNRGNAHGKLRDVESAIVDFDAAIRLNPKLAQAHNLRGVALRARSEFEQAIESHTAAINLQPQTAIFHTNRGITYRRRGDHDKAIADFDTAIKLNPNHAPTFTERAFVLRIKRDFTRALADHAESIRLAPNAWQPHSARGFTHEARNDLRSALADLRKAHELFKDEGVGRAIARIEGKLARQAAQPQDRRRLRPAAPRRPCPPQAPPASRSSSATAITVPRARSPIRRTMRRP